MRLNRRKLLGYGASTLGVAALGMPRIASAQESELTIAYNVNLPSWDPTVGPSAVNPTIQGFYQSVFDQFILNKPDLSFAPGLITEWGWNDDRSQVMMTVRDGVTWHDGSPFTADDIVWSLERAGKAETGNPIQFVWKNVGNFRVDGNKITGDVIQFDPTLFKWMSFLTGYVMPKAYYEKVGPEGFEKAPIGTGPYMVERFEQNAFLRLKANPNYWGGKPAFENVTIKFVPDAASRVAEIESGSSQVTLEIPYEEYDRLTSKEGLSGACETVSDIGMIFFNDIDVMLDANVRKAAVLAVDKKLLVDRLLRGYGLPIDTLETPEYAAFDPSITVEHNPDKAKELLAASGYSPDNPVKFTIQTTRGFKPKDYEMVQAIVGMWRKVGIEASIEVYEIAKHYELRAADTLAPAAFYNWGNSIGDPTTSTGFAMFGPSPHSVWDGQDVIDAIGPLWGEADEDKRIAGWKAVSKLIADNAYVLPLLQYAQPIVHSDSVNVVPHKSGALLPALMTPA
ncbi:peptide ABC transporter substrate-binding protein [Nitratireductor mangrovi]|uniref:Peptide ABC transporter substrate-binding protein n=1 Tax=Nitratireductor mangrovi TaxID=2599600 RepID=A0A5B8L454_9HYPH|nr:ABC transporter substrate-binding protein [Nitratireductor mangrovi]QDZ02609.1 peptide ABC transporter substrate-binding protein [Nitratireductor mangrovi]